MPTMKKWLLPSAVGLVLVTSVSAATSARAATSNARTVRVTVRGDAPPAAQYNLAVTCQAAAIEGPGPLPNTYPLAFGAAGGSQFVTPPSLAAVCGISSQNVAGSTAGYEIVSTTPETQVLGLIYTWKRSTASTTLTTATRPPAATLMVDPVDFGNVLSGQGATRQAVIRNPSSSLVAVVVNRATTSAPFGVAAAGVVTNCSLAPGASCTLDVTFQSPGEGTQQATLLVSGVTSSGGAAQGVGTLTARSGDRGDVELLAPTFAPTMVGQTSAPAEGVLNNVGSLPYRVGTPTADGPFAVVSTNCPPLLQRGQRCLVQLMFRPVAAGAATGTVRVLLVGPTNLDRSAPLSGIGLEVPRESIAFVPPTIVFADAGQGDAAQAAPVQIFNTGQVPVTISQLGAVLATKVKKQTVVKIGPVAGGFGLKGACTGPLAPGKACDLVITMSAASPRKANLTVRAVTDAGTATDLTVLGRVLRRGLAVSGPTQLGMLDKTTPKVATATVRNIGELPVSVASLTLARPSVSGIALANDRCTKVVLPIGATCTVDLSALLVKQPPGPIKDRLSVVGSSKETAGADVGAKSPRRKIVLLPAVVSFGGVVPGASVVRPVTVRNVGDIPVTIKGIVVGGAGAPAYGLSGPTCIGTTLPVGGQCVTSVKVTPVTLGAIAATLTATGTEAETAATGLRTTSRVTVTTAVTVPPATVSPVTVPPVAVTIAPTSVCAAGSLAFNPNVGTRGQPAEFFGKGFTPNQVLTFGWKGGPMSTLTADGSGGVRGSIMVFGDEAIGGRELVAVPATGSCPGVRAPYLLVLGTASPPRPDARSTPVFR